MDKSKRRNLLSVYKTVARIVSGALKQEGTLRSLVFEHAKKFIKTHLRLAIEVVRHRNLLEKLVSEVQLVENEDLTPEFAQVLVYELLLGNGEEFKRGIDVFDRVIKYKEKLENVLQKLKEKGDFDKLVITKPEAILPRYGRVNTLLASLESVVSSLQKSGFELLNTEGKNYEEFLECVRSLQLNEFVLDFHFPQDLLVFNPSQFLGKLFVCRAGHLILHDKTSYFPVACLGAPPGSTVLDACAAPGIKTSHIAAKMKNEGKLIAMDNNGNKMKLLINNLNLYGVQNCETLYTNFLAIDPNSEPFKEVEFLLLDVPSSHSGNRSELMRTAGADRMYGPEQLRSMSALQFKFITHALNFPKVKRIVYSTTSNNNEENEEVVGDALRKNPEKFKLARAFPEWHVRGSPELEFGKFCVRTQAEQDQTLCSFVAVIERIENGPAPVEPFSMKITEVIGKTSFVMHKDRVGHKRKHRFHKLGSGKKLPHKKSKLEFTKGTDKPGKKKKSLNNQKLQGIHQAYGKVDFKLNGKRKRKRRTTVNHNADEMKLPVHQDMQVKKKLKGLQSDKSLLKDCIEPTPPSNASLVQKSKRRRRKRIAKSGNIKLFSNS